MNHKFKIILLALCLLCLAAPVTWAARLSITDLKAGLDAEILAKQAADAAETVAREAVETDICVLYYTLNTQYSLGFAVPDYCPVAYAIGDSGPAGGIVFYITDAGIHGLEAAPEDQQPAYWGCAGRKVPGADGVEIGTGKQNTADIIAETGCVRKNTAAKVTDDYELNGFTDWFLPSKRELYELWTFAYRSGYWFENLDKFGRGGYWSSSELTFQEASMKRLTLPEIYDDFVVETLENKDLVLRVRAIRSF